MSIYKPTATEILNVNCHYVTLPAEVLDTIARRYGATTLAVWTFLLNQAPGWVIRKDYVCKVLKISERKFQEAMRNLDTLELAWLANGGRDDQGRLHGKAWHVSGLPRALRMILDDWRQAHTDNPENAESVAPVCTPEPVRPESDTTDYAENRQSVTCVDITKDQLNKQDIKKPDIKIFAQNEFARFYAAYPRKRDRARALNVWMKLTRNMDASEITNMTDSCIAGVNMRIRSGEWRALEYIPYAKSWLASCGWDEPGEGAGSAIRLGLAAGQTVNEIFNPDIEFDDGVLVDDPNAADFDAWLQKKSAPEEQLLADH